MLTLSGSAGGINVSLTAQALGRDLAVCIMGGEAPHIGAVAVAQARPSLEDPARVSASCSVICLTGHKEDQMARQAALHLAAVLDCVVSISCGIHVDDIEPEAIWAVLALVDRLTKDCGTHFLAARA